MVVVPERVRALWWPLFESLRTDWLRCVEPLPCSDLAPPEGKAAFLQPQWPTVFDHVHGPGNGLAQVPEEQVQVQGQEPEVFEVGALAGESSATLSSQPLEAHAQRVAKIVVREGVVGHLGGGVQQAPLKYSFPDEISASRDVCGFSTGTSVLAAQPARTPWEQTCTMHLPNSPRMCCIFRRMGLTLLLSTGN